ncbi:unnamed protein product [Trichogramma brassicae]|uniref:Uncharacterized protein n=2 Tax=Trichogramma TaxID=7490 RepID=A0A6H5IS57_9HYME|nr:unnamed protein product [Trichogramma brassicae]
MEKWQWEICKMFLYMSFPVACFHYFNSPQIFEESVTKLKLESCPPMPVEKQEKIKSLFEKFNSERELKHLEDLEKKRKGSV